MAEKLSPVFRKSVNGYNREDVNKYIRENNDFQRDLMRDYDSQREELSRQIRDERQDRNAAETKLAETQEMLEKAKAEIAEKDSIIAQLKKSLEDANALNGSLNEAAKEKDTEIETLKDKISDLESAAAAAATSEKSEYYDSICTKAGEILFIASDTAEEILNRANDEAQKIVGDATTKKDLMLKTLSRSVDEAAGDINIYIKRAVDDCIEKINKRVSEVSKIASPAPSEKAKSHKPVIINVK